MAVSFKIVPEGDGFYTVKDVPIFQCHDNRGFNCDEEWMRECVQNFTHDRECGHRPAIIVGHNVKGVEKECKGFLDNFRLKGKRLYADLVRIPRDLKERIVQNAFPSRSCEVLPTSKRILALALLGGTTPFFTLPQMVYNNDEPSFWSPAMPFGNQNNTGVDVNEIAKRAAEAAIQQYSQQGQEEEPEVFQLNIPDAAQYLQNNPDTQIFQGEDGGFYCVNEDETGYYQLPEQLMYGFGMDHVKRAGSAIAAGARRAGAAIKSGAGKAGEMVKSGASATRKGARAAAGGTYRKGKKAAQAVGRGASAAGSAVKAHPYLTAGAAGAGAGAGFAAGRASKKGRYQFDEETGVVYFNGVPVGEMVAYEEPTGTLPDPHAGGQPDLVIEEGAVGEDTNEDTSETAQPGDPGNTFVNPLHREDSDQFSQLAEATQYALDNDDEQTAELYQLRQEVGQLRYANELTQVARKGESLKNYLLQQKKIGCPVGNIDQTVDYLLTQTDEQIKQFKRMIETAPKINLGHIDGPATQYSVDENAVKAEYQQYAQQYSRMGVMPEDLKWGKYVRTNAFVNQSQPVNGASFGDM